MEIIDKLPIELMREIIRYDIHPVAELFKKEFKQTIEEFTDVIQGDDINDDYLEFIKNYIINCCFTDYNHLKENKHSKKEIWDKIFENQNKIIRYYTYLFVLNKKNSINENINDELEEIKNKLFLIINEKILSNAGIEDNILDDDYLNLYSYYEYISKLGITNTNIQKEKERINKEFYENEEIKEFKLLELEIIEKIEETIFT